MDVRNFNLRFLIGVLRRFQHCTGHITTGSWKGRGNQYIQFISDRVKIPYIKKTFDCKYSEKWSCEIFTVTDHKINQNQPMYQLKDYNNDIKEGYFYEPELQLVYTDNNLVYKIEKKLKEGQEIRKSRYSLNGKFGQRSSVLGYWRTV